jgi:coatomer protein complex subunit gamma
LHVVFQFKCTNTIKEQVLENVSVAMELLDGAGCFEECASIPLESMPLGKSGSTYVAFSRVEVQRDSFAAFHAISQIHSTQGKRFSAKFACTLKFTSKEVDPISDIPEECGYEDEYTIEDVELSLLDFMCMTPLSNFRKVLLTYVFPVYITFNIFF